MNSGYGMEFLVGHVGRFDPQKNHKFLLKIFAKLKKLNPTAKLMLVGNGNGRDEIVQMAERMGLKDAIIFTGVRADVNELMQAMDVFVLPSLYEGLPVTMVEAQAAGLPCVISDKVPTECAIVDGLVKSVALSDDLSIWVDALQKAKNIERKDHTQEIYKKKDTAISAAEVADTAAEVARFEEAQQKAIEQQTALYEKALAEAGEDIAEVFNIHAMMLDDDDFVDAIKEIINGQHKCAEYAVKTAGDNQAAVFAAMDDPYLQARSADVIDNCTGHPRHPAGRGQRHPAGD